MSDLGAALLYLSILNILFYFVDPIFLYIKKRRYVEGADARNHLFFNKNCKEIGDTEANRSRQTKTKSIVFAQIMRIAVHSTRLVVLCANTLKA